MAFTLNIETDNAAFTDQPAAEIARILQDVAHYLTAGSIVNLFDGDSMKLRDINGNTVGRWEYGNDQEGWVCGACDTQNREWETQCLGCGETKLTAH